MITANFDCVALVTEVQAMVVNGGAPRGACSTYEWTEAAVTGLVARGIDAHAARPINGTAGYSVVQAALDQLVRAGMVGTDGVTPAGATLYTVRAPRATRCAA